MSQILDNKCCIVISLKGVEIHVREKLHKPIIFKESIVSFNKYHSTLELSIEDYEIEIVNKILEN